MGDDNDKKPTRKSTNKQDNPSSHVKSVKFTSRNPYLNFLSEFRKRPENRHLTGASLMKAAGKVWKSLSPNEKMPYINAAKKFQKGGRSKPEKKITVARSKKPLFKFANLRKAAKTKPKKLNTIPPSKHFKREDYAPRTCSRCGHREGDSDEGTSRCSSATKTDVSSANESRTTDSGSNDSMSSHSS